MDKELRAELTELQSEWLSHLRAWEQSGGSLKSYAEYAGVDHRRLYLELTRFGGQVNASVWKFSVLSF